MKNEKKDWKNSFSKSLFLVMWTLIVDVFACLQTKIGPAKFSSECFCAKSICEPPILNWWYHIYSLDVLLVAKKILNRHWSSQPVKVDLNKKLDTKQKTIQALSFDS